MGAVTDEAIRVLVVDDSSDDLLFIKGLLARCHEPLEMLTAESTSRCLDRLQSDGADVVLLDYSLPGEDGLSFVRRLSRVARLPPIILVTGRGSERLAAQAIRAGAFDYVAKDELTSERLLSVVLQALEAFRRDEEECELDDQIMVALAAAAEGKDATTAGHLKRISHCAVLLGRELGLRTFELEIVRYGALLHDIGKLAVRVDVLGKPGPLTADEWEEMQQHVLVGERICSCLWCSRQVAPIIRYHHERWDGGGYVEGLAGVEIPYFARIVSVVDAFDAMSTDRPYRRALEAEQVLDELRQGAGSQWDPDITETFVRLIETEGLDPIISLPLRQAKAA